MFPILCLSLFTGTQRSKILSSLGYDIVEELKDDSAEWFIVQREVEEDPGVAVG